MSSVLLLEVYQPYYEDPYITDDVYGSFKVLSNIFRWKSLMLVMMVMMMMMMITMITMKMVTAMPSWLFMAMYPF